MEKTDRKSIKKRETQAEFPQSCLEEIWNLANPKILN